MASDRWVRLDVNYFGNPKIRAAGRDARDLHLASICFVGRYMTDGYIAPDVVEDIARDARVTRRVLVTAIGSVVDAGLWIPNGEGFELHDYLAMNPTRAEVEKSKQLFRDRQKRYRDRQKGYDE